jgi:hypothetical protein
MARLRERLPVLAAVPLVLLVTFGVLASLVRRVGTTDDLRRAVIRGDVSKVQELVATGADPEDRLWWGRSAIDVAREEHGPQQAALLRLLERPLSPLATNTLRREAGARGPTRRWP